MKLLQKVLFVFIILIGVLFVACDKEDIKTEDPVVNPTQGNETPEEVKYVVTFDVEGVKETIEVKEGEKVSKPLDPAKEGYTFTGWYIEEEQQLTTLYDFEKAVTSDITLVAKFKEAKYVVTFDVDGAKETVEVKEGEKVSKPLDPAKDGFVFLGWYADSTLYDFESLVTADITLVARFEEEREYYLASELKEVLDTLVSDYINSLNGSLKVEIAKGEDITLIDLVYNYKDKENVESLKYEVTGAVSSHIYVKEDVVYVLSNGVTSQEELTSSSSDLLINSYGVSTILLPSIKFYDEQEFYNALEFVSFEENITKYSLSLNSYSGSKVNVAGKESVDLYVKLDGEKVVYVEFVSSTLDSVNKVKVEFLGLEKSSITYPDNLSSYGE